MNVPTVRHHHHHHAPVLYYRSGGASGNGDPRKRARSLLVVLAVGMVVLLLAAALVPTMWGDAVVNTPCAGSGAGYCRLSIGLLISEAQSEKHDDEFGMVDSSAYVATCFGDVFSELSGMCQKIRASAALFLFAAASQTAGLCVFFCKPKWAVCAALALFLAGAAALSALLVMKLGTSLENYYSTYAVSCALIFWAFACVLARVVWRQNTDMVGEGETQRLVSS